MSPRRALARQALADGRTRTVSFALLFLVGAALQSLSYGATYPTRADRLQFARSFGDNQAIRLLYGVPHDLLTVGGYLAWRLGGTLTIFAALWGVLAAVRALRTEEETGRQELVLASGVARADTFRAALEAIAVGVAILWLALLLGILSGGPDLAGSAYLALAIVSAAAVFAGVGALASQLAPTRRGATLIGSGVLAVALLVRMVADTAAGLGWLRWCTPLGWVEELRAFGDPQPVVLLAPALSTVALVVASARIAGRRDVGVGLLAAHESGPPRRWLLSSPTALALRLQLGTHAVWFAGVALFAVILGVVSDSVTSGLSETLREQLEKLGSSATPAGYMGFVFEFFALTVALFGCFQLVALREDEADQQLETVLALPVSRDRWLAGRLALATASLAALALAAGLLSWLGAALAGADVGFGAMVGAGANCLPVSLLFLGLGALAFGLVPRATATVAYGLVGATFTWQLVGELIQAPGWALAASPFDHVGLVPAQPFAVTGAIVMLVVAALAAVGALRAFARRDLVAL